MGNVVNRSNGQDAVIRMMNRVNSSSNWFAKFNFATKRESMNQSLRTSTGFLCVMIGTYIIGAGLVCASDSQIKPSPVVSAHLARAAVLDLGLRKIPSPADYQLVTSYLSLASDLDPTNADLARSVVEAAWSAGDLESMINATRRVIKIDPGDTVAQLRLVSSVINQQQTIEGRLKLYDRFLSDAGKSLDSAVRSRLALDAALLEREHGNAQGFIERLHLATKFDASNKAAASLAAQFYSEATSDPVTMLEYQLKLLMADPLDPNVQVTIARIFAREGAYESARRFLGNAVNLYRLESGRAPSMVEEIRIALNWQIDGPQRVLDDLNPMLEDRRAEAQARIDNYIELQLPIDDLLKPEEILYELGIDKIRLLAAFSLNDMEMTQKVLDDIDLTVNNEINAIGSILDQRGVNQNLLLTRVVAILADFQVMRAVVGLETEDIRGDIENIVSKVPAIKSYFDSIEPLALYADGEYERAIEMSMEFPQTPVLGLIRALANEKIGNIEEASDILAALTSSYALESWGAFSRSKMIQLGIGDRSFTTAGRQMAQIEGTVPRWLDKMISRPSSFIYLDVIAPSDDIGPLENPTIKIRLKNLAPIPLAVGPSQPMDSRILIVPKIDNDSLGFQGVASSKVVSLNQRLRLRPLEEMVVEVPVDSPRTQWLIKMQSNASIRQRWRILQGFRPRTSDEVLSRADVPADASIFGIINSPLGLTAQTDLVQRLILDESKSSVEMLIESLGSADEDTRRRAVIACAGRLMLPATNAELSSQEQSDLIDGLMELYTRSSNDERARLILLLPHRHQIPEMMAFDDHVMSLILSDALIDSQVDPIVLASALLTRADASDSPIFEVFDQVSDQRLVTIAEIIRDRLETSTPTLGTIGPGVESMFPLKEQFGP
jgi:tetratricopeptide (TPR) repeat protein